MTGFRHPEQIRQFADLEFIPRAENIVFIGPTGVGKTGLACSLLLKALQNGHRGLFVRAQDLFDEMCASLADRSSRKLLNRLARVDVLCVDESPCSARMQIWCSLLCTSMPIWSMAGLSPCGVDRVK